MGGTVEKGYKKSFAVNVNDLPKGLQPYKVYNVEELILVNRIDYGDLGSIKRVVEKSDRDGETVYYEEGQLKSEVISKEEYTEVFNTDGVSVRNYTRELYEFEGSNFEISTIGRTSIKYITFTFDTKEERENFVPYSWLREYKNSEGGKKSKG